MAPPGRVGVRPRFSDEKYSPASMCPSLQPLHCRQRRRCRLSRALLDELLLVTGLAPALETNLREEPCEKKKKGSGGCFASISRDFWIRAWSWVPYRKDGGAHEKILLRKQELWCLVCGIALELVWVPTLTNPVEALSRNKPIESWNSSLPKFPSSPTAVLDSAHALSELDLLRDPLSAAAHTAGEHVRTLESSGAFSCSEIQFALRIAEDLR